MARVRSVEIDLLNFEVFYTDSGFILLFRGHTKNGNEYKIRIKLWFCSMAGLARAFWKVVNERQARIDYIKTALREGK